MIIIELLHKYDFKVNDMSYVTRNGCLTDFMSTNDYQLVMMTRNGVYQHSYDDKEMEG